MPCTSAQAKATKKWLSNNPDKIIEYRMRHYYNHLEEEHLRRHRKYIWKKESLKFLNILL